jgi:DNA replication protein DnaC
MNIEKIQQSLKGLRLSGMGNNLPVRYQEAKAHEIDYLDFIENLIDDEISRRQDNLMNRRLKLARFPYLKTLDEFDFDFNPGVKKKDIMALCNGSYIFKAQNILFVGPPGVGKSHLSVALGVAAVHNGYTVTYRSIFDLAQDMADAADNGTRKLFINNMLKANLLVIDEFGMKKLPPNTADDLLEIMHRRYQKSATIIATNRIVSDWGSILGDNAATAAILDRFLDDAAIFNIKGRSYRLKSRRKEAN